MAYNQGVSGGYPNSYNTTSTAPGISSTGINGGYVHPPSNIHQTTGMAPGVTSEAGTISQHVPVVGQQYVAQTPMSYAVSKKKMSISGGDWIINDPAGHSSFKVDGRIASMRDKRYLRDAAGNKILTLKKKLVTMHDAWEILAGDGDHVLATCKKSALVQVQTAMDVMLASSTTGRHTPDYQLRGDYFNRNMTIFRGSEQVALVTRQITFTTAILDKNTFGVTIFPGVDQALIFALIVIMDEIFLGDSD